MSRLGFRVVVDPTSCDGYGTCAELLPEWIEADEWGFPVVRREALPSHLAEHAERAVHACPRLAIRLVRVHG